MTLADAIRPTVPAPSQSQPIVQQPRGRRGSKGDERPCRKTPLWREDVGVRIYTDLVAAAEQGEIRYRTRRIKRHVCGPLEPAAAGRRSGDPLAGSTTAFWPEAQPPGPLG